MSYVKYVIGVDPSGAFEEGKGTTGLSVYNRKTKKFEYVGAVYARDFNRLEEYFIANYLAIVELVRRFKDGKCCVSIEDFLVYQANAKSFTNSKMETCQLLGYLKPTLYRNHITYKLRPASAVKTRWTNEIMEHKGYIHRVGKSWCGNLDNHTLATHELDAMRHALHCSTFELEDKK